MDVGSQAQSEEEQKEQAEKVALRLQVSPRRRFPRWFSESRITALNLFSSPLLQGQHNCNLIQDSST